MLVKLGNTDITDFINPKSYKVNVEKEYESWLDGNYNEHRIYTRQKVKGSFTVALYGKDNMTTQAFLDLWNACVNHNVATITVFVQNENVEKEIQCYYSHDGIFHREMVNDAYCDVLTVEIMEK